MTTFAGVKAQKYNFESYIQWFNLISILRLNKKISQINAQLWRLLTDKPKSRDQFFTVNKGCIFYHGVTHLKQNVLAQATKKEHPTKN